MKIRNIQVPVRGLSLVRLLLALAVRPRQVPERLNGALERAERAGTLTRIELGALSHEDARELLGDAAGDAAPEKVPGC